VPKLTVFPFVAYIWEENLQMQIGNKFSIGFKDIELSA